MSPISIIAISLAALCAAFGILRGLARRIENYGIVDIAWVYGFAVVVALCGLLETGWPVRRIVLAILVLLWSSRLGTHVALRVIHSHPREDARYAQLRREWAGNFESKMTGFFQLQAGSVVLLSAPFYASCHDSLGRFHLTEFAGFALWLSGLIGESVADAQLKRFKLRAPKEVCTAGLWRYSRHPNYFFEWVIWLGFAVFACGSPWGWIGFISPACILYFLLFVTGIPMTEEQAVRSKGEAYRRYQQTTSAFVPWPTKRVQR